MPWIIPFLLINVPMAFVAWGVYLFVTFPRRTPADPE